MDGMVKDLNQLLNPLYDLSLRSPFTYGETNLSKNLRFFFQDSW